MNKIKVLSWNVRGLGDLEKCNVVRNVLRTSRCDVVLLQETKLNEYDLKYFSEFLPTFIDRDCASLQAIESRGGCIVAWKRSYTMLNSWTTRHTVSVILQQNQTGCKFLVTNVYGPSVDAQKLDFLLELQALTGLVHDPWLIGGDFNMVRWMVDRSNDMRGLNLMCSFNDLIRQ